ncbi:MAG: PspC domain-containing protein [Candidatus Pedobacter colombiensis]|uniref:PspC domain-containing protein n=1 Tax=Candidatus Pedobacter colombiensis TaxID=3121371 RepID=A0AAJ5W8W5_9SPHI|nr:PspC domain-containing protein [Pedobacter sp.]WEK19760.1 MAG: PspC domain-containing protein [Pedobacter sp.]
MKKTHNINIGNSIIHIEEDAYEMLTVYLNEVKQHFSKNADDFEIVTDIENRIAEMFAEKLSAQQKQVINMEDVQSVMQQMGSVRDFETLEGSGEENISVPEYDPIKKLYRDTDQAMVAGVCAGLGHYLDIDAKWVRLFTLLTIFLFGSGVLIYIIFWIMVPKAKTRFEKMAMYGEEPTLRGFANSHFHPLVKHSRGFLAEFFEVIGNFLQGAGKIILKTIAGGIALFGSLLLLAFIVAIAALFGFWDGNIFTYFPLSMVDRGSIPAIVIAFFVVFGIPVFALVLFSVRVAFNGKAISKAFSFGMLIVWLVGVFFSIFYIAKISSEFKETAEFTQVSNFKAYPAYTLEINRSRFFTKEDSLNFQIDPKNYRGKKILNKTRGAFDMPANIRLRIEKSDNKTVSLSQNYRSDGKTFEIALKNAQNIHYDFLQQDSLLTFSPRLQFLQNANWRNQRVELVLKVPVGTQLKIQREFEWSIASHNYWRCDEKASGDKMTKWIMTEDGLECVKTLKKDNEEE